MDEIKRTTSIPSHEEILEAVNAHRQAVKDLGNHKLADALDLTKRHGGKVAVTTIAGIGSLTGLASTTGEFNSAPIASHNSITLSADKSPSEKIQTSEVQPETFTIPDKNTPKGFEIWNISSDVVGKSGFKANDYDYMVNGTDLAGVGQAIYDAEQNTNINGLFMLSHMAVESNWGKSEFAKTRNNFWGLGAYTTDPNHAFTFKSTKDCLDYYTNLLSTDYLKENGKWYGGGTTVHDVFVHYSTSDTPANEIAGIAEDETIVNIINHFTAKLKKENISKVAN